MSPPNLPSLDAKLAIEPKDGDVFRFSYSAESWEQAKRGICGDLNWCFDGQLVYCDGLLCDTYWGLNWRGDNGRYFKLADALAKGILTYVCNLNDVEPIRDYEYELYAEGDAFNLSYQHGCYKHFVKRKGAKKDKSLMLAKLHAKVTDARKAIESASRDLEYAVERREQLTPRIEAGEEPSI